MHDIAPVMERNYKVFSVCFGGKAAKTNRKHSDLDGAHVERQAKQVFRSIKRMACLSTT